MPNENIYLVLISYTPFDWHKKCILTHLHFAHREVSLDSKGLFHRSYLTFLVSVCVACDSTK